MKYIKLSKIVTPQIIGYLNEMAMENNNWESWQEYITYNNINTEFDEYSIENIVSTYYNNLISAVLTTLNKNGYQTEKESETNTFESFYYLDVRDEDFYDVCFCINGARQADGRRMLLSEAIFSDVTISNMFDMMFGEHLSPAVILGVSHPCAAKLVYNVYRDTWFIKNTGWGGNQNTVECYYNYFSEVNDTQTTDRLLNTLCKISQAIRPDTKYQNALSFQI